MKTRNKIISKFAVDFEPLFRRASGADKRLLAVWALGCAERVLPVFEALHPTDLRPRMALETLQAWLRGECNVTPARRMALAAHAAARESVGQARFAARSAAQAVSVAHAKMHVVGAAYYAAEVFSGEQTCQFGAVAGFDASGG